MTTRLSISSLALILGIGLGLVPGTMQPGGAQSPQMTPDQARQALLPYVMPPDTTLSATPVTTMTGFGGGAWYLFYGDSHRGRATSYQVDATTGEKMINYYGATTWDLQPDDAPPFLTSAQLAQTARSYAAVHFPGYAAGMPEDDNGGMDATVNDVDCFSVGFIATAPSGAQLPISCDVGVVEDTGSIADYTEKYIPVTIDTNPAITADQAQAAAQNWIAQNISADPDQTGLVTTYTPTIALKVEVDPLLDQALLYEVVCYATCVVVDAQTDAVVRTGDWASISLPTHKGLRKRPTQSGKRRETLWPVYAHQGVGPDGALLRAAVQTNGTVYLWAGYLKMFGIQLSVHGQKIQLKHGVQRLTLPVRDHAAGSARLAWQRNGSVYLPTQAVQRLNGKLSISARERLVTLNIPSVPR